MKRPSLEVADLVRAAGRAFFECSRKWITWQHLKVLRAIARCRTAALGGHLLQQLSYGEFFLMGSSMAKGHAVQGSRPFDSPLRFALQKRDQFVRRSKLSSAKAWWNDRLYSLQLLRRIGPNVDFRGSQIAVSQPKRDFPDVLGCL